MAEDSVVVVAFVAGSAGFVGYRYVVRTAAFGAVRGSLAADLAAGVALHAHAVLFEVPLSADCLACACRYVGKQWGWTPCAEEVARHAGDARGVTAGPNAAQRVVVEVALGFDARLEAEIQDYDFFLEAGGAVVLEQ